MKLTKQTLKRIIKEELDAVMKEAELPTMSRGMPGQREDFKKLEPGQFTIKKGNGKNIGDILYVKMEDGSEMYAGNLNQRDRWGDGFDQNRQRADAAKTALIEMGYEQV